MAALLWNASICVSYELDTVQLLSIVGSHSLSELDKTTVEPELRIVGTDALPELEPAMGCTCNKDRVIETIALSLSTAISVSDTATLSVCQCH